MPRRSDGEGTEITRGADGRWHAWLSFGSGPADGGSGGMSSAGTRQEVAAKVRKLQAKRDAGVVPIADGGLSVAQWLRHWLETIAASRVRPGTLYDYRLVVEKRLIPALGHHRLNRLEPEHVEAFYRACMSPQARTDSLTGRPVKSHRFLRLRC